MPQERQAADDSRAVCARPRGTTHCQTMESETERARDRGRERAPGAEGESACPGKGPGGETRERGEGERDPLRRSTEVDKMGGKT
jgi:hypothetical protein